MRVGKSVALRQYERAARSPCKSLNFIGYREDGSHLGNSVLARHARIRYKGQSVLVVRTRVCLIFVDERTLIDAVFGGNMVSFRRFVVALAVELTNVQSVVGGVIRILVEVQEGRPAIGFEGCVELDYVLAVLKRRALYNAIAV